MKQLTKFLLSCAALISVSAWASSAPAWRDCPLARAEYRDAGLQGFTLVFSEFRPSPESSGRLAQVTVWHAQKGIVSRWDLPYVLGLSNWYPGRPRRACAERHDVGLCALREVACCLAADVLF